MDYTALNTLLITDPDGIGFAPLLDKSDTAVAALFNDPAGKGAATISLAGTPVTTP